MRFFFVGAVLAASLVLLSPLSAQAKAPAKAPPTAVNEDQFVDEVLAQKAIDLGHAAWLVGRSLDAFDEKTTPTLAGDQAEKRGWSQGLQATTPLTWLTYSQVLLKAFQVPGGVLYGWSASPRYAYRELVFRKIVPPGLDPDAAVSGEEAMRTLQAAQDWKEAQK